MAETKLSKPSYLEGNSKEEQKERKEITKVVEGKVKVVKKPAGQRLRESLGLEQTRTVGDYLVWDVLLPAAKEMIADLVKKGIDVFLYGGTQSSSSDRRGNVSRVSYDGYYNRRNRDMRPSERRRYDNRATQDLREFVFERRQDAEDVLSEMCEIIDVYGFVKMSDFYSMVGETERNFLDHGYGWEALGSARVERCRDGWYLELPKPVPIN